MAKTIAKGGKMMDGANGGAMATGYTVIKADTFDAAQGSEQPWAFLISCSPPLPLTRKMHYHGTR